jgi:hypothetical protein
LIIEFGVNLLREGDSLLDTSSPDTAFVTHLNTARPRARMPVPGSDIEIVFDANNPERYWFS